MARCIHGIETEWCSRCKDKIPRKYKPATDDSLIDEDGLDLTNTICSTFNYSEIPNIPEDDVFTDTQGNDLKSDNSNKFQSVDARDTNYHYRKVNAGV